MTKGGRAVIIGAGFIGLEAAASLRARGMEVDVVAPDAVPLERVVGPELGHFVQSVHEDHGVRFHLGHKPAAFVDDGVRLDDGRVLPASVAVTGVGVRPRVELAKAAGLTVDDGIVCDAELRTSAPGIWAAGDVAKVPDPRLGEAVRIEHWVVAERQGQAVARAMLGRPTPWTDVPFFWSQHHDATISVVHLPRWDRVEVRQSSFRAVREIWDRIGKATENPEWFRSAVQGFRRISQATGGRVSGAIRRPCRD